MPLLCFQITVNTVLIWCPFGFLKSVCSFAQTFGDMGFLHCCTLEALLGPDLLSSVLVTYLWWFLKAWWWLTVSQNTTLKHPRQNQADFLEIARFIQNTSSNCQVLGSWEASEGILLDSFEQTRHPRWLFPLGTEYSTTQERVQL